MACGQFARLLSPWTRGPALAFSSPTVKSSRPARGGSTKMVRSRSSSQGPSPSSRRRLPRARIVSANSSLAMRARNTLATPFASKLKRAASTDDLDTSVATTRRKFRARGTYIRAVGAGILQHKLNFL
ncbi:hypothetical protein VaNZ11_004143 [Volvox africanus]|uniref:Uncharacterized protein n=1 Tax=Volvox africanus TaxID=51714 RepID=A0ABQ5RVR9_9CHLO|nr:hypothetical protein VaNZ11_004143 [Volvox africanus]